jgi:type I restriction enzyme S subunit
MTEKRQTVKFGDICREVKLTTKNPIADGYDKYIGLEHLDSESLKIKRWGSIAEDNPSFTRVFKKGQILFGKRRSYLKKASISEFDGVCSSDIVVMEPRGNLIIPELLPFIVQSEEFWDWSIKTSSGSLSPRTKFKSLADFRLNFLNKEEQNTLLFLLNSCESNLSSINDALYAARELKRILISKLFSNKYLKQLNVKQVTLKNFILIQSGQVDPKESPYNKLPHIAPDNIEKNTGRLMEFNTAEEDKVFSGKYYFDSEWILYSKIRPNLRKLCFPKFEGICSADVYPIKGNNGLKTEYLFYLMQSEHFNRFSISTSMRSGFPKINREDLGAYKFFLPNSKVQDSTIESIRKVDSVISHLITNMDSPITIRSKLIQKYMG